MKFRCLAAVIVMLIAVTAAFGGPTLTAQTSRPNTSTFAAGEKVLLSFHATGLASLSSMSLTIVVKDAHDTLIAEKSMAVNASADGSWSGEYTPPTDRLGFYRVFPTLTDGTTLPKLASRHAGYLTYAIVVDPAKRIDYGENDSLFGMQGGFNKSVDIIPYLGIRWVLQGYAWGDYEKDHAGQFAQDFAAAKAKGQSYPGKYSVWTYNDKPWNLYVMPCFTGIPKWAAAPGKPRMIDPKAEGAWASYCKAVANAYTSNYPTSKVHLYQLTWEPDFPWDHDLARIYQVAYPALHEADPLAQVVGPTGDSVVQDPDWLPALLDAGLGKSLDGYTNHPYFRLPPERNGLLKYLQVTKDILRKHVGRDLPLYGTEQGFATQEDPSKEILQAQGLVRENLIMFGEGFRINFAFYIHDYPEEPGFGFFYNLRTGASCGTDLIAPKPVAPAYAAMTWLLDGHRSTERIDWLSPTTLGYVFDRGGDVVLALWDYGDRPRDVMIPVGVGTVSVYDWMGNARTVSAPGGALKLTLSGDPIYIKGASTTLWGVHAHKPLRVVNGNLQAFPGRPVVLSSELTAATMPLKGALALELDPRLRNAPIVKPVKLARGGKKTLDFNVYIPGDAELGGYSATLVLKDGAGQVLAGSGARIDIVPPVIIGGASPVVAGNRPCLTVTLRDAQNQPVEGDVATRLEGVPGSKQTAPIRLAGHQTMQVNMGSLDADIAPSKIYRAAVRVRTKSGYEYSQTFSVDFLQAPKMLSAQAIDGDLTKWNEVAGALLAGRESVVRSPQYWTGDTDLSATVKYAWDDNALYLAVDVTDDVFCQEFTGFDTWRGDCLQIGIDVDNGKQVLNTGNEAADKAAQHHWSELTLALTHNGPEVYCTGCYDTSRFGSMPLSDIPLAVVRNEALKKTYYEAKIPWRMLGKTDTPKAGDHIGVALSVNDRDDRKGVDSNGKFMDVKAVGLFGGMNGHKEMSDYGVLTLAGEK